MTESKGSDNSKLKDGPNFLIDIVKEGTEEELEEIYNIVMRVMKPMISSIQDRFRKESNKKFVGLIPQNGVFRSNGNKSVLIVESKSVVSQGMQKQFAEEKELKEWFVVVSKENLMYSVYWGRYSEGILYPDMYSSESNTTDDASQYQYLDDFDLTKFLRLGDLIEWAGSSLGQNDDY